LWLLGFLAVHNLSEFLVISRLFSGEVSDTLLRLYYVSALFSVAYMCIFAMSVAHTHKAANFIVLGLTFIVSTLIVTTDSIVTGAISVGYTVTAIKGSYYFVFQLLSLSGFSLILFTLVGRYLTTRDSQVQLKCFYAAFTLSPIIIISFIVIMMMQFGYQYTGALLLPFASTFFLVLVILTEEHNDLMKISYRLPFSKKRAAEKEFLTVFRSHMNDELGLVETKNELEKILIQSALDSSHGNVTRAADKLMIKRSTFYSIINRLEMKKPVNNAD